MKDRHSYFNRLKKEKELVIYGNSPFIDTLQVDRISERYTTAAQNHFCSRYAADYCFQYDELFDAPKAATVFVPVWFDPNLPESRFRRYVPRAGDRPVITRKFESGKPIFTHKVFTTSIVLNWAIVNGFTTVYLSGIDHIEVESPLPHFDGQGRNIIQPRVHRKFKKYVESCTRYVNIYQTNPAVKDDWNLPYCSIEQLMGIENEHELTTTRGYASA